jgi:hypothetical protein
MPYAGRTCGCLGEEETSSCVATHRKDTKLPPQTRGNGSICGMVEHGLNLVGEMFSFLQTERKARTGGFGIEVEIAEIKHQEFVNKENDDWRHHVPLHGCRRSCLESQKVRCVCDISTRYEHNANGTPEMYESCGA